MAKVKRKKVEVFEEFQNHIDLVTYCEFNIDQRVGAYLLQDTNSEAYAITFGWRLEGIHSYLKPERLDNRYNKIKEGLKDFPPGDSLLFKSMIRPDETNRCQYLDKLSETAPIDELSFFTLGDKKRTLEVGNQGNRVIKEDYLFVTYYPETEKEASDWIEKGLMWVEKNILSHFGEVNDVAQDFIEKMFRDGHAVQQDWGSYLTDKLGLKVFAMTPEEMKQYAWSLFNNGKAESSFPQKMILDKSGLRLETTTDTSAATLLTAQHTPVNDRAWIYHPHLQKYSAILTFYEKPYGWPDIEGQLRYLIQLVQKQGINHIEFNTHIWRADERLSRITMEKLIRQSKNRGIEADSRGEVNVQSEEELKQSTSAMRDFVKGSVTFKTGVTIVIYSESTDKLKKLCRTVENSFQSPARVRREKEVCWELWLQGLPITRDKLLMNAFSQRVLEYRNEEVIGFLPFLTTLSSAKQGVEMIAQDTKIPVYLDLFSYEGRHAGYIATSRSGKSVKIGSTLTTALSQGIPVIAIDYPGSSGRSTFSDYTSYLQRIADYFDVRVHSFNLFDRIDLSKIEREEDRKTRWNLNLGFLKETLVAMVLGAKAAQLDARLETEVKTIISFGVNRFFQKPEIIERYEKAEKGGIGSEDWQLSPTLRDFIKVCSVEEIKQVLPEDFIIDEETLNQTLYFVKLQLSYWVNSELGNAIANPSSVKPEAMLIVFALTALKEDESLIFALIAFTAAYSRSLQYPRTLFFIDESPILLKFPAIAKIVASLFANGSKSGIRVVLSAQAPNTIAANPETAGDILQNMHYKMIGKLDTTGVNSCVDILGIDEDLVRRCVDFEPDKVNGRTQWLFFDGRQYTYINYYAPPVQLATLINNTDEAEVRELMKKMYPNDIFKALYLFSELFKQAHQENKSIKEVFAQTYQGNKHSTFDLVA